MAPLLALLVLPLLSHCQAAAAADAAPNDVDCAFRELAVRVASRNLHANAAKLALVADGLNASACPGGHRWAADHAAAGSAA